MGVPRILAWEATRARPNTKLLHADEFLTYLQEVSVILHLET